MFAIPELLPYLVEIAVESPRREVLLAREIARRYLSSLCNRWQGCARQVEFERWLASYWRASLPVQPERPADATSPHGGGGRGIDWYGTPAAVVGYIPGVTGGYWIPVEAIS